MCGGGGGQDPMAYEKERQAKIQATIDQINEVFSNAGRSDLYNEHRTNVEQLNRRDLDRKRTEAERQLRFSLARAGLAGGQSDVDAQEELKRRYDEGLLQVSGLADKAAEALRTSDERTRLNVITQAQSGLDSTSATQAALRQLESNQQNAYSENQAATLGDLFSGLATSYGRGRYLQGQQAPVIPGATDGGRTTSSGLPSNPGRSYQGN